MEHARDIVHDPARALDETIMAGNLPEAAGQHLARAAQVYHDAPLAEAELHKAFAIAPSHAAVLIGLYRFYFYQNRLGEALKVAKLCLAKAAADNGFAESFREVRAEDANFSDFSAVLPRFFLFTLKAYAYLNLRLANFDEGHAAAAKLLDLDPTDKIGAKVLIDVIDRMGREDD